MNEINVVATFSLNNQSQKEIGGITSTFSVLNAFMEDTNQSGNEFLQTLKNLNIDSSTLQKSLSVIGSLNPNLELIISANDPDQVLEQIKKVQNLTPGEPLVEVVIRNSSNDPDSPFNLTPEQKEAIGARELEINNNIVRVASDFDTLVRPILEFYIQNADAVNASLFIASQRLLLAGGALAAGFASAPFATAALGATAIVASLMIATGQADDFADATQQLFSHMKLTEEEAQALADRLKEAGQNAPKIEEGLPDENDLKLELEISPEDQERIRQEIKDTTDVIDEERSSIDLLEGAVAMLGNGFVAGAGANSQFKQKQEETTQAVAKGEEALQGAGAAAVGFAEETENASQTLDALGVFAADIAANINDTFADLISNGLQGNFDNLGDLWDDLLDTETEENQQNVIFLDEFRENEQEFRLAA